MTGLVKTSIMRRGVALIFTAVGLAIMLGVSYNTYVGPFQYEGDERYKLNWPAWIGESSGGEDGEAQDNRCSVEYISERLNKGRETNCLGSVGVIESQDIMGFLVGSIFILIPMAFGKKSKVPKARGLEKKLIRGRRRAKIRFGFGFSLLALGLSDMNGLLDPSGQPLNWSELIGVPIPDALPLFDLILIALGVGQMGPTMMYLGKTGKKVKVLKKQRTEAGQTMEQRKLYSGRAGKGLFKGKLETHGADKFGSVADLYAHMGLENYEDEFERALKEDAMNSLEGGKTCHLCAGQGCAGCNNTGML